MGNTLDCEGFVKFYQTRKTNTSVIMKCIMLLHHTLIYLIFKIRKAVLILNLGSTIFLKSYFCSDRDTETSMNSHITPCINPHDLQSAQAHTHKLVCYIVDFLLNC